MSSPVHLESAAALPLRERLLPVVAVYVARLLVTRSPATIRAVLARSSSRRRAATYDEAAWSRSAVVSVSRRCASQQCLQRATAAALLCRMRFGSWPTWNTGVRTRPFGAHAWISVGGYPVGEQGDLAAFKTLLLVTQEHELT